MSIKNLPQTLPGIRLRDSVNHLRERIIFCSVSIWGIRKSYLKGSGIWRTIAEIPLNREKVLPANGKVSPVR